MPEEIAFLLPPATKLGKVIFSQGSVILFTGGGVRGGIPACLAGFQAHTQGGRLRESGQGGLQAFTQGGSWGDLARGWRVSRPTPKGKLRGSGQGVLQAHTGGGLLPGGAWSQGRGVYVWSAPSPGTATAAVCILLECILILNIITTCK